MNKEELIEVLRQFDEKRVEELPEKTRNIFYAIMEIADEIDRLNNIINKLEEYCWELKAMGCREGSLDMLDKIEELKNGDNK